MEAPGKIRIAICIPAYGSVPSLTLASILDVVEFTQSFADVKRFIVDTQPVDKAREQLTKKALQWGADYLLWLDSDMTFPADIALRLLAAEADIVSGLYCMKQPPYLPVARIFDEDGKFYFIKSWEKDSLIRVSGYGLGCCLVRADIFNTLPEPHFYWSGFSEDINFCIDAGKDGYELLLDTSVKCGHVGGIIFDADETEKKLQEFLASGTERIYPHHIPACDKQRDYAEIGNDIAGFLGEDISEVCEKTANGASLVIDEWQQRQPRTENEITRFYMDSKALIYDLAAVHGKRDTFLWQFRKVLESMNGRRLQVLDFGCGIGTFGMLFSKHGFKVTFADFESRAFELCRWRCNTHGIDADFIDLGRDELAGEYDVILCVDVLERVPAPVKILEGLLAHLVSPGGLLVVTTDFGVKERYPLHLDTPEAERRKVSSLLDEWGCQ